ncbi:uncharacterized protein LOC131955666 [Physella acuta]|uniref:uncharacterized protein LOC131955666 n=1 Tax=Physella acuta TaxID=109671 RepID=UPI0027DC075D|nr:uncharacterized protein LOC131955666 [Physella acuta]
MASSQQDNASMEETMQNSTLLTQGLGLADNRDHLQLCVVHILLALWGCLANSSQIVNILFSRQLRSQLKNVCFLNLCLVELVNAGFLCPLYSDTLMQGTWRHSVTTCVVYELTFYTQVCVSTLGVLAVLLERFYYLLTLRTSQVKVWSTALLATPWLLGLLLVLPLFWYGSSARLSLVSGSCEIIWKKHYQTLTIFASFFCPAFLDLALVAALVMMHVMLSVVARKPEFQSNQDRTVLCESLRVMLLTSFTCVLLQFPFFLVLLLDMFCQREQSAGCGQPEGTWAGVMMLIMLKPGVTPLTGLAYSDLRRGFYVFWRREKCREVYTGSELCSVGQSQLTLQSSLM